MTHYIKTGKHGIFVPKYTEMGADITLKGKMQGHFTLVTSSPRYGSVVRADFDNLILDAGLNRLAYGAAITACQVGGGSTAPAVSQTALASYIAGTTGIQGYTQTYQAGPPDHWKFDYIFRFNAGAAAGNLSEVGVGWATTGSNLFSRALILDALGNPTSLTILSDEVLDVYYTVRWYPPQNDTVQVVNINGTDHTFTIRPQKVNVVGCWTPGDGVSASNRMFSNGWTRSLGSALGVAGLNDPCGDAYEAQTQYTRTSGPSPSNIFPGTPIQSYVDGSLTLKARSVYGLNQANFATGIGGLGWGYPRTGDYVASVAFFHAKVEPKIPKDNTKVLTLQFDFQYGRV